MAADQGVRYVVTLQDMNVTTGLKSMEGDAVRTEASIASLNSILRGMAGAFGIGFGIHELVDFGKSVVDTGASFEQLRFMMKISSKDNADYIENLKEAKHAVEDFKLPIEDTYKSWGKLIAAIKGTPMEGAPIRSMFEDLSKVFAVMPVTGAEKGRAFYAIREMFEEQVVQTRHFVRQLSIAIPGIMPMAEQLTGTTGAQFKKMLQSKDPNAQIKPAEFLPKLFKGLADQYATVANMNEQMGNIAPNVEDITNKWKEFKDELAIELKPEIMAFFGELKGGISWLREHERDIITFGHTVKEVGEIFLVYKGAVAAINLANATYGAFMEGYLSKSAAEISSTELRAASMNALAASMERVAYASELMAGASLSGVRGLGSAGIPLASAGTAAITTEEGAAAFAGVSIVSGALLVALTAGSVIAITNAMADKNKPFNVNGGGFYDGEHNNGLTGHYVNDTLGYGFVKEFKSLTDTVGKTDTLYNINKRFVSDTTDYSTFGKMSKEQQALFAHMIPESKDNSKSKFSKSSDKISPPTDHITGSKPITYNITIKEMGNIGKVEVNNKQDFDIKNFKQNLSEALQDVLNDVQIRTGN